MSNTLYFAGTAAYAGSAMREAMEDYMKIALYNLEFKQKLGTTVLGGTQKDANGNTEVVKGLISFEADAIKAAGEAEAASISCQAGSAIAAAVGSVATVGGSMVARSMSGVGEKIKLTEQRSATCQENLKVIEKLPAPADIGGLSASAKAETALSVEGIKKNFQWDDPKSQLNETNFTKAGTTENKLTNATPADREDIKTKIIEERKRIDRDLTDLNTSLNHYTTLAQAVGQFIEHGGDLGCKFGQAHFTSEKAEEDKERQVMSTLSGIASNQLYSNVDKSQQAGEQGVQTAQQNLAALYSESHRA